MAHANGTEKQKNTHTKANPTNKPNGNSSHLRLNARTFTANRPQVIISDRNIPLRNVSVH